MAWLGSMINDTCFMMTGWQEFNIINNYFLRCIASTTYYELNKISWTAGSDMGHFQYNVTNHSDFITIKSQIARKAMMKIRQNIGDAG